jgi:flagellar FliJ protein
MAKRYVFRFETMLKLRQQREDHHKRIVAERIRQITATREQIASIQGQIQQEMEAMRVVQGPGTLDLQQTVRHRHWLGRLHRLQLEAEGALRGLEAKLAQERAELAEAAKQRRVLEKLKERQAERYRKEMERREMLQLDEMATQRHNHEQLRLAAIARAEE